MKAYKKPILNVEHFVPNEFVAACKDENEVFKFVCDASSGSWIGDGGSVYVESNGQEGWQFSDTYRSLYHPCSETHEAKTTDEFLNGYIVTITGGVKKVIIWTDNNTNTHCTTNLETSTWQTAKS